MRAKVTCTARPLPDAEFFMGEARNATSGHKFKVIVNPYGVIYINDEGTCSYSSYEYFDHNYSVISIIESMTLELTA